MLYFLEVGLNIKLKIEIYISSQHWPMEVGANALSGGRGN